MRERRLLLQPDQREQALDPRGRGVGAIERGKERDDLGAVQVVEKRRRLQLDADDPVHLLRLGDRIEARHPDLPAVRGA